MEHSLAAKIIAAAPFIATSLFYSAAPELTRILKEKIRALLQSSDAMTRREESTAPSEEDVAPPALNPRYIEDYLEYTVDAAQVLPTLALPILAMFFALSQGLGSLELSIMLAIGVPVLVLLYVRILLADPVNYAGRKYFKRYSLLPLITMVLNGCAGVAVLILV